MAGNLPASASSRRTRKDWSRRLRVLESRLAQRVLWRVAQALYRDEGDLYALVACNEIGGRRLLAMMDEYKLGSIEKLGEHVIARSRTAMLASELHRQSAQCVRRCAR